MLVTGIVVLAVSVIQRGRLKAERLAESLQEHAQLLDLAHLMIGDAEGRIMAWNSGLTSLYGFREEEAIGKPSHVLFKTVFPEGREAFLKSLAEHGHWEGELVRTAKDGSKVVVASYHVVRKNVRGETVSILEVNNDITGRVQAQRALEKALQDLAVANHERETDIEFLQIINRSTSTDGLVDAILSFLQGAYGLEAVGIRLKRGDEYPYYGAKGFARDPASADVCSRDGADCILDGCDEMSRECMCANVLHGRFDAAQSYFTDHGSFWTNSRSELLAAAQRAGTPLSVRESCNSKGYESVALIPLHDGEERLGLLHMNDHRKGIFSAEMIALWERFADYLAVALSRFRAEEALHESELHKRDFYRQTILAATSGKLLIAERDEITRLAGASVHEWRVGSLEDVGAVRVEATAAARDAGMDESRVYDFMACVVESTGNAAKHAKEGRASMHVRDDKLVFVVGDAGPGISAMSLPDVALTRGYTTAGTLGMGYKVMIAFADKVYLATGQKGTTVAVEMKTEPDEPSGEAADLGRLT